MKEIDLEPKDYRADIPNKPEPIFGPGLWETGIPILVYVIVGTVVHSVLHLWR